MKKTNNEEDKQWRTQTIKNTNNQEHKQSTTQTINKTKTKQDTNNTKNVSVHCILQKYVLQYK